MKQRYTNRRFRPIGTFWFHAHSIADGVEPW